MHDLLLLRPPLAVVTAAASGPGLELARCCARHGFDLLVVAEDPAVEDLGMMLRTHGTAVQTVQADPAEPRDVARLLESLGGRRVDALVAHAGHGLDRVLRGAGPADPGPFVKAHLKGTVEWIQRLGRRMQACGRGRVLLLGPAGDERAEPLQALCHGTRLFIAGFSDALRQDFDGSGPTVTCCMPPPGRRTPWADRPGPVAAAAFRAMMRGDADVAWLPSRHGPGALPAMPRRPAAGRPRPPAAPVGA
jgi:short-subunit dehydrogenase